MIKADFSLGQRVEREVERERHERELHDDVRAGVSAADEFRTKDARERICTGPIKRQPAR